MVKVLIFNDKIEKEKPDFYKDIVKYTNSQNSINENAFGASKILFSNMKKYFLQRGFLLLVQPSDRNTYKTKFDKNEITQLLNKANRYTTEIDLKFSKLSDIFVPLDKMLQIYLALIVDGSMAYKSKSKVLKPDSPTFKNYSTKINEYLSWDNMVRLYILFKKAEADRKQNIDKTIPIPYYLIGFFGYLIKNKDYNLAINRLFSLTNSDFMEVYNYLKNITKIYSKKYPEEYNIMIKNKINLSILTENIETIDDLFGNQIELKISQNDIV